MLLSTILEVPIIRNYCIFSFSFQEYFCIFIHIFLDVWYISLYSGVKGMKVVLVSLCKIIVNIYNLCFRKFLSSLPHENSLVFCQDLSPALVKDMYTMPEMFKFQVSYVKEKWLVVISVSCVMVFIDFVQFSRREYHKCFVLSTPWPTYRPICK